MLNNMNTSKKNFGLTNGWILCPSTRFPGKFYYFNVINGEAAWSLNEADKKALQKDSNKQKTADKFHNYPEPTTLPDDASIISINNNGPNIKKPDFQPNNIPYTQHLPTFGQSSFPKFSNVEQLMPNIIWTPIQLPMPMFYQENKTPMMDEVTQTSDVERDILIHKCDIPLCQRFKNYENPFLSFNKINKIMNKPIPNYETSTSRRSSIFDVKPETVNRIPISKPLIKEPVLKLEKTYPSLTIPQMVKSNGNSTLRLVNKFGSTKSETMAPDIEPEGELNILDSTDLRFLLLAKRKKPVDNAADDVVERKKPKPSDFKHITPKKKVTFDLSNVSDEDSGMMEENVQEDYIPLTNIPSRNINIDISKSPSVLHIEQDMMASTSSILNDTYEEMQKDPQWQGNKDNSVPTPRTRNESWYIVADTDVLLLDYEFIDNLVIADPKCILLIPHAVKVDIEALCMGDCRGQQRVINARQLTRRLIAPPQHYLVEPPPNDEDIVVTTESILHCCVQAVNNSHHVVLITNDPHLQTKASERNIPCYRLNEIKNGVNIKPDMTKELNKNKMSVNNSPIYTNRNNLFLQKETDLFATSLFSNRNNLDTVKKQLFENNQKHTDDIASNCDKLINITKSKSYKMYENNIKNGSDSTTSDISRDIQNLNLIDKNILTPQNQDRHASLPQKITNNINMKEGYINFEKKIQNTNSILNTFNDVKPITHSKEERLDFQKSFSKPNREIHKFQETLNKNMQNPEKQFYSTSISNITQSSLQNTRSENGFNSNQISLESSGLTANTKVPNILLRHNPYETSRGTRVISATQSRINKMLSKINDDSTTYNKPYPLAQSNDITGVFKIPQPLHFKNRTENRSALIDSSITNDKIRTCENKNKESVDDERFSVKSKIMCQKIISRMDEWICTYTQIMEDLLNNLLQKNGECMKDTALLTFHDTLNCIKTLYASHTNINEIVDNLLDLLNKCTCKKGKLNLTKRPDDFMKILRYGCHLVQVLKNILPLSEELKDAEACLNSLINNIESETIELDPELLKTPFASRSSVDGKDEVVKPSYVHKPSYVIDYLKKHFKEWASYKGNVEGRNCNNKSQNHTDFKVVRTFGKNLSMLKIDNSKTISLNKMATEDQPGVNNQDKPKIIRPNENQPVLNPVHENNANKETFESKNNKNIFLSEQVLFSRDTHDRNNKYNFQNSTNVNDVKTVNCQLKVIKSIQNVGQESKNEREVIDFDFPTNGNTFMQNEEISGPVILRNIKLIDEYEKKIQNKQPLDLDLLDYSEIYELPINDCRDNLQFDLYSENKNSDSLETTNENNIDNYEPPNTMCTLEDFTSHSATPDNHFYATPNNNDVTDDEDHTFNKEKSATENNMDILNDDNNTIIYESCAISISNSNINDKVIESYADGTTFETENYLARNVDCIDNDNCSKDNDNCRTHNDNFEKTSEAIRDDSTNDSGFENDSTYAHTLVKIFLNELSTTFKAIYEFVNKFVIEISGKELCETRKNVLHNQASKSLEDMVAIIQRIRSIIKRESTEVTVLKSLLLRAGVEASNDKKITRYRQVVMKCLEQAQLLENTLRIIVSTSIGDFDAISTNAAESINSSIRYFNIFE